MAEAESSLSTGTAGSPSPAACATALPGSTRTPCPDRSIYRRRATDTGRGGVPSQHGQPLAWAVSPRAWLGAVPSRHHVTPGTRRGQGHFAGAVFRVRQQPQVPGCTDSPERGGGLAGGLVPWPQPRAVARASWKGTAQASVHPTLSRSRSARDREESGVRCQGLGWGYSPSAGPPCPGPALPPHLHFAVYPAEELCHTCVHSGLVLLATSCPPARHPSHIPAAVVLADQGPSAVTLAQRGRAVRKGDG